MRRGKTYSGHGRVLSGSENGPRCVIAFLKTACLALAWIPPPPHSTWDFRCHCGEGRQGFGLEWGVVR